MDDMRKILAGLIVVVVACSGAWGQTHKVSKPENVVRAVGVYEWTGDLAKPGASRLIPVTLFIDGELQDAGVYMARPVPFALETGNVYELQDSGVAKGFLDLAYARHVSATDATGASAYDDGWFGYGSYKPPVMARKSAPLRASKTLPVISSSASDSKPHLSDKSGNPVQAGGSGSGSATTTSSTAGSAGSGSSSADDPDRPTMKRRTSDTSSGSSSGSSTTDTSSTKSGGDTPADDPDRPTMQRRTSDTGSGSGGTTSDTASSKGSGSTPSDDPDRPTLKRRSPGDAGSQMGSDVGSTPSLNNDPDRPNLHHGRPAGSTTGATDDDLPKMTGLPTSMHQLVAVSDAANRDPHEFARPWEDAAERAAVLAKMQGFARALLAGYKSGPTVSTTTASDATTAPGAKTTSPSATAAAASADNGPPTLKRGIPTKSASTTTTTTTAAPKAAGSTATGSATATKSTGTTASRRSAKGAPAPVVLMDEELKGYTLSYGGAATYVYTANTGGTGADLRYVTVVAQADGLGELKPAIQSVTDAAHLDRAPWMRLVDVVDVEASNRASLLFEMRAQNSRQFGLYRVIATKPEQIFLTGSTQ